MLLSFQLFCSSRDGQPIDHRRKTIDTIIVVYAVIKIRMILRHYIFQEIQIMQNVKKQALPPCLSRENVENKIKNHSKIELNINFITYRIAFLF